MSKSDEAIREFAVNNGHREYFTDGDMDGFDADPRFVSDLTALISEDYVSKEEYAKVLQQRDELKEALKRIADPIGYMQDNLKEGERLNGIMALRISENAQYLKEIAEAAIKNTDG